MSPIGTFKIISPLLGNPLHKGAGIFKTPKTFLNKGTKHKKNYMEEVSTQRIKILKVADPRKM